jgi:hypothetical protein
MLPARFSRTHALTQSPIHVPPPPPRARASASGRRAHAGDRSRPGAEQRRRLAVRAALALRGSTRTHTRTLNNAADSLSVQLTHTYIHTHAHPTSTHTDPTQRGRLAVRVALTHFVLVFVVFSFLRSCCLSPLRDTDSLLLSHGHRLSASLTRTPTLSHSQSITH